MGSRSDDGAMIDDSHEAVCSDSTIEIKIKTLDSRTHTLRVDKHVEILALKERIAAVTDVPLQQQRLIYQGRILENDQILSAYDVKDGHFLHLVDRPPIPSPSENLLDNTATYPASSAGNSQSRQVIPSASLVLDNLEVDLSWIFSFVLSETARIVEEVELGEPSLEWLSGQQNLSALGSSGERQPDRAPEFDQSILESQQPPVISDPITPLFQFLNHLRHQFDIIHHLGAPAPPWSLQELDVAHAASRLPTPASLGEVMMSTRLLLIEQVPAFLLDLAGKLVDQANVTDSSTRMGIEMDAHLSGPVLQDLGALLLELGRVTRGLQLGETPDDATILAGPSVYISTSGSGANRTMIAGLDSEDEPQTPP